MRRSKIKLLIIEDEEQMKRVLSYIIQNSEVADFEIREASSAEEAIRMLSEAEPDIIICDYLLEKMSGIEFFSDISIKYPDIVKILISGNVNYDELRKAVNRGDIFRYLAKPFNEDEILAVLRESVEKVKDIRQKKDLMQRLKDF
ncbi:MAG: response regulator [Deltaproteobacteria bacterium]|nr:response regulator [Deltaproteobacteria bacterium]